MIERQDNDERQETNNQRSTNPPQATLKWTSMAPGTRQPISLPVSVDQLDLKTMSQR
jgi:hypothetical protein